LGIFLVPSIKIRPKLSISYLLSVTSVQGVIRPTLRTNYLGSSTASLLHGGGANDSETDMHLVSDLTVQTESATELDGLDSNVPKCSKHKCMHSLTLLIYSTSHISVAYTFKGAAHFVPACRCNVTSLDASMHELMHTIVCYQM
jgi:hypothetical protein